MKKVKITLENPYIELFHTVEESIDDVFGRGGQLANEGFTGPFIDIDTGEVFTISHKNWAQVSAKEIND